MQRDVQPEVIVQQRAATPGVLQLKAVNQAGQFPPLYLHLEGDHRLPRILGTGRSAVVFLAATTEDTNNPATRYRAVKFVRDDPDKQYAEAAASRFFQEAGQAQRFHDSEDAFVRYEAWGALGKPEDGEPWWRKQFARHSAELANDGDEFRRLKKHFDLQGPFYVLDLCQGTLHDMLDKSVPWSQLQPYTIQIYRNALNSQSDRIADDIRTVSRTYFTRPIAGRSGYEILNAFKSDASETGQTASRIRNYAVLELFEKISYTVAQLHSPQSGIPLAHRDLKPGNIFFQHAASETGFQRIEIRLSDLGYVVMPADITSGEKTLVAGKRGAEYLAPGSQFFRAPEQAELPTEVRVDVDPQHPRRVSIKGSKINDIQIHDWLTLSDLFGDQTRDPDTNDTVFKILSVAYEPAENTYLLELDRPVTTSKVGDLQGQITRSTGFQTDGFSLGAILYDLISGGRDPELFYLYCLASYTSRFAAGAQYSIDDVVEILSPRPASSGQAETDKLTLAEKWQASQQIMAAPDLDTLLSDIQNAILLRRNRDTTGSVEKLQEKLRHFRFRNFQVVRELLTDRRGVPIPRDILEVIVRCMLRDVEGAYYQRDPVHAFQTDMNYRAAARIHERINDLLSEAYRLPEKVFPQSLSSNLLFKLRSMAPQDA